MELALQTVINAWVASLLYAIVAMGLALIFGVVRTANFAHAEFLMVGAYAVWLLYAGGGWPFFAAVLAAAGVVAGIGLITERAIFRSLRGNMGASFMASTGLIYILQVGVGEIWGVGRAKPVAPAFTGSLEIFGTVVGWQRVVIIPIGIVTLVALWVFLYRTRLGRALRATAQDPVAASLQGISINRVGLVAMGIAGALAGIAGGLMAPIYSVTPYMGGKIIMMVFIIVIVGGMGSLKGAFLASILFGFLHTIVTTLLDSTIANIIAAVAMAVLLVVRPQGLLGREKI